MFLLLTCFLAVVDLSCAGKPDQFNWDEIQPSWDLEYTPCYGELECARLLLPLDWLNEEDKSRTVAVAIIKRPAKVDITDDAFGGTVITNPGGPGDSGVVHILKNGHYLQGMVDGKLYYEVLSFDPRGMFHSTPVADCYEDDADRSFSEWQMRGFGLLGDSSAQQFRRRMAHATAFGQRCARADKGQSSIREFMSTASVARDMLAMVEKIELLRQKKIAGAGHDDGSLVGLELRANEHDASEARIQYFGTSYGTFLGNTFLSMFPGRVHRMILDGLVVPEEYVDLVGYIHIVCVESDQYANRTPLIGVVYQSCRHH